MNSRRRIAWRPEEDQALIELLQSGDTCWQTISEQLSRAVPDCKRSSKQCRERWSNFLDPRLNRGEWTEEELQQLFSHHQVYGNSWRCIARVLPDRSENAIKNCFNIAVKKAVKEFNRGRDEDQQINLPIKALLQDKKITVTLGMSLRRPADDDLYQEAEPQVDSASLQQSLTEGLQNFLESLNSMYNLLLSNLNQP